MHISEYMCSSCLKDFGVLELPGRTPARPGCPHCGGRDLWFKFDRLEAHAGKHLEPDPEDDPEDDDDEEEEESEDDDGGDEDDGDKFPGPSELN